MSKPLNWSNLKKNKCPQCGKDITMAYRVETMMFECKCGFKITKLRFEEIVSSSVKKEIDESYYNVPDEK